MSKSSMYRNQNAGDGSWSDLLGDIYSGCAVGIAHPIWWVGNKAQRAWGALSSLIGGGDGGAPHSNVPSDGAGAEGGAGLRVVGVGYGRTGTYSLALALDELGIPTLHTQHLYEHPKIFDHLVDEVFLKSINQGDVTFGNPDFDLLIDGGFGATMDLPFALYFESIAARYPGCKFVLTVRESSEVWFRSWDVLAHSISQPARYTSFIFSHVKKLEHYMRWLFSVVNDDNTFLSSPFPFPEQNRERAIASYERHNRRVRELIPADRLLEYSVKQGWEPLCKFLEVKEGECPSDRDVPFPRSNSMRAVRWQAYSAMIGPLIATLFVLYRLLRAVFRGVTGTKSATAQGKSDGVRNGKSNGMPNGKGSSGRIQNGATKGRRGRKED